MNNFTQEQILLYVYRESDEQLTSKIELAAVSNKELAEEIADLTNIKNLLKNQELIQPNPTSVAIICEQATDASHEMEV